MCHFSLAQLRGKHLGHLFLKEIGAGITYRSFQWLKQKHPPCHSIFFFSLIMSWSCTSFVVVFIAENLAIS